MNGRVTVVGPNELEIASYRGEMDVAVGDKTHVVSENSAYRVLLEPSAQGQPPSKAGRARFTWIVLVGVPVGTGIGIWRAMISPSGI